MKIVKDKRIKGKGCKRNMDAAMWVERNDIGFDPFDTNDV